MIAIELRLVGTEGFFNIQSDRRSRKEIGLLVTDKIILKIQNNNIIEKAIFENRKYILNETLADDLVFKNKINDGIDIEFDNIKSKLSLKKNN